MKILLAPEAIASLNEIPDFLEECKIPPYIIEEIGNGMLGATLLLETHPHIGAVEPLLSTKKLTYRRLIYAH